MEIALVLGFVALAALIIWAAIAAQKAKERRIQALSDLALELGFRFLPEGTGKAPATGGFWQRLGDAFESPAAEFVKRFDGFRPFGIGHSPRVENLIVGNRQGIDWYLFDYTYMVTTSNGKTTTTTPHPNGVVAVRLPLTFPPLSLTPENLFHRIGTKLGMQELTFELEEFNRRYFIRSSDPKGAHDVLHPRAIDALMRLPIREWQMGGTHLLIFKPGVYDPLEVRRIMTEIEEFLALLPEYVRQDRGFNARWTDPLES